MAANSSTSDGITIYYDGDCPFCSRYVRKLRLDVAAGPVTLVDMRRDDDARDAFVRMGLDPDRGMVVDYGGRSYAGAEAMTLLAALTTPSGVFNRVSAWAFRTPRRARLTYPVLRAGRRLALWLLRRPPLTGR